MIAAGAVTSKGLAHRYRECMLFPVRRFIGIELFDDSPPLIERVFARSLLRDLARYSLGKRFALFAVSAVAADSAGSRKVVRDINGRSVTFCRAFVSSVSVG